MPVSKAATHIHAESNLVRQPGSMTTTGRRSGRTRLWLLLTVRSWRITLTQAHDDCAIALSVDAGYPSSLPALRAPPCMCYVTIGIMI